MVDSGCGRTGNCRFLSIRYVLTEEFELVEFAIVSEDVLQSCPLINSLVPTMFSQVNDTGVACLVACVVVITTH